MSIRGCFACLGVTVLLLAAGCAGTPKVAMIPEGEWEGDGTFVAKGWPTTTQPTAAPLTQGTYPTVLKISRHAADGQPLYRVEVTSERGAIPGLEGDRTHIVAYLKALPEPGGATTVLYRLQSYGLSMTTDPPQLSDGPAEPAATCMVDDDGAVLQIHYAPGFNEVLIFRGGDVYKLGTYYQSDKGLIDWSEELERR